MMPRVWLSRISALNPAAALTLSTLPAWPALRWPHAASLVPPPAAAGLLPALACKACKRHSASLLLPAACSHSSGVMLDFSLSGE